MANDNGKKEEIKNALDIVEVIEQSKKLAFPLKLENGTIYRGAISANSKSGKSLIVDKSLQLWNNFSADAGSIKGGDVFDWIAYENDLDIKTDFSRVLGIAAGKAGIELDELSEEEQKEIEERKIIHDVLTVAAEIYHSNLTPEIRQYITKKWGISNEIIDRLKIGYAKPGNAANLAGKFDNNILIKTGLLVYLFDDKNKDKSYVIEFFQGRIVFPYWYGGKVVAFAARGDEQKPEDHAVLKTPDNIHETAKYKKLLTYSEKHDYVSKCINNSYIWGEDTTRGQDYCVITEGIADAIVLMQHDIPVLSPVTTKFAKHDIENLLYIARKVKTVYICNDNEESGAGEDGAIRTGLTLKSAGIDVRIMLLPKENLDKMDVAEYFLRHTKNEFLEVQKDGKDILVHLLNKIQPSKTENKAESKTENMKKATEFIKNTLVNIKNEDDATLFIRNNIKENFDKFTGEDIKTLIKVYKSSIYESASKNPSAVLKGPFDLDSESGRSSMTHTLAREILSREHLKFIGDSLRVYDEGIYSANPEAIARIQNDILSIAMNTYLTPIMEKHVINVLKVINIMTAVGKKDIKTVEDEIAVNNGILNLKTFELSEFTPEKVFLNKLPIDYNSNAPQPEKFLKFMSEIFKGNEKQYDLMQEIFGYTLLNNYKYQVIIYMIGDGGNGKGTLLKILTYMLGKENTSSASIFQLTDHTNVDYYVAGLYGKRANICGDVGSKRIENTENLKKLSSNTDELTVRVPYGLPFSFINNAKIILAMNRLPKKDAFTTGDKRRDVTIQFKNRMSDTKEEIKGLSEIIRDSGEMPGVLNWAIEGLKRLEANQHFTDDRTVTERGHEYDMMSNPMKYFVDECIEQDTTGVGCPNAVIYDAYDKYRKQYNMPELSDQEIKNGIKYWCNEVGIHTEQARVRIEKVLGFGFKEFKDKLGKQPHVFTGIKLINGNKNSVEPSGINCNLNKYESLKI